MRKFFGEQGLTRVFVEAYTEYSADENPRRTPLNGKITIYEWKILFATALLVLPPAPTRAGLVAAHFLLGTTYRLFATLTTV